MTLAEAVLAFGLMAVLAVVVIGVFTKLMVSTTKSTDLTAAQLLARSVLDRAVRAGPPDWGVDFTSVGTVGLYTHDKTVMTDFVYQVVPLRLTPAGSSDSMGELYEIGVTVSWWTETPDANAGHAGVGKVSTQISRTVFIRK